MHHTDTDTNRRARVRPPCSPRSRGEGMKKAWLAQTADIGPAISRVPSHFIERAWYLLDDILSWARQLSQRIFILIQHLPSKRAIKKIVDRDKSEVKFLARKIKVSVISAKIFLNVANAWNELFRIDQQSNARSDLRGPRRMRKLVRILNNFVSARDNLMANFDLCATATNEA